VNKKRILINIYLNVLKKNNSERLTKDWLAYRISIFMKYTLQSLIHQTNQDFLALIQYEDESREIVGEELRKYKKLPENIRFVTPVEYRVIEIESMQGSDYFYYVRIDSDDMYHKSYIQQLHDHRPDENTEVLICQNGYLYDSVHNQITSTWRLSPPFYAFIYKTNDYLKGKRYVIPGGHTDVIKFKHVLLKSPNFVIVVHSSNDYTQFRAMNSSAIKNDSNIIDNPTKIKEILTGFME
jgi:hypothetical protein